MANFVFPRFRLAVASGLIDCAAADWRATLLMANSSVLSQPGTEFMNGFSTLGEHNGPGFARVALTGELARLDVPNMRIELDANDVDFGVINPGSLAIKGALLYIHTGLDSANRPAIWIDQTVSPGPSFPYYPVGAQLRLKLDPEGFAWL